MTEAGVLVVVVAGLTALVGTAIGLLGALVLVRAVRRAQRRVSLRQDVNGTVSEKSEGTPVPETVGPAAS